MTSTAVRFWGRTAQCSDHSVSILPHFNNTCATENYICKNFDVKKSYNTEVLRKAAWINWAVCLCLTVMSVKKIYSIWIKEKNKVEGWPWSKKVYGINVSHFKSLPRALVGLGLLGKLLPSLSMDVIDILMDTFYFHAITQQCGMLDPRLHTPRFVFHTLFSFMVLGMLKNLVINNVAHRQLTKRLQMDDLSESDLVDSNAYMAITFFQGVLSFVFQDAAAAIIQYFYIDKYTKGTNSVSTINGIIMLLFSIRVTYVFIRYIYQYWDKDDPPHVKALHGIMLGTKISVGLFHATRMYAVTFSKILDEFVDAEKELASSCFLTTLDGETATTEQTPFTWSCLSMKEKSLFLFTFVASVGVLFCTVLVFFAGFEHFKIFNQSHYTGRIGNVSGTRQTGTDGTYSTYSIPNRSAIVGRPKFGNGLSPRAYDTSINRATELGLELETAMKYL